MNMQMLIDDCAVAGVSVHMIGGALKLRGAPDAVQAAAVRLLPHKAALLEHLATLNPVDLVAEFMEVDGLSRSDAEALAAVSVQPRPRAEWLAMIAELDGLVAQFCAANKVTGQAQAYILAARNRQSLASIPAMLEWYRREQLAAIQRLPISSNSTKETHEPFAK